MGRHLFLSTPSGWRATAKHAMFTFVSFISIHALRVEGDFRPGRDRLHAAAISIHALRVEGDRNIRRGLCDGLQISIHALRVEGDPLHPSTAGCPTWNFYPRPPGGGRPCGRRYVDNRNGQISIHALRVEGDYKAIRAVRHRLISIHALRVEGDATGTYSYTLAPTISIHALRVEGDDTSKALKKTGRHFYPRPPGGGRQREYRLHKPDRTYFYPRPPGGGRRHVGAGRRRHKPISIHALRVEGDQSVFISSSIRAVFLSTPSGWRATYPGGPEI